MKGRLLSSRVDKLTDLSCGLTNLTFLLKKAQEEREKGIKLIDCALGESSLRLRPAVKKAGWTAIEKNENSYTKPFFGLNSLRKALSFNFKKEGIEALAEEIIVTAGAGMAIDLFFRATLNPGDEVIIFDPFYPPFIIHTLAYEGRPVFVDTYKTGFIPEPSLIKKKITKKAKIIVINSPNNPTGAVYPLKVLKGIVAIARKFNLMILSDEVYADFVYEGKFVSMRKLYPKKTTILRSFSKKYGMMGYKVGYLTGPDELIEGIKSIMLPMHTGPRISEIMAAEAIKRTSSKRIINNFKKKRNFIYENLKNYYPGLVKPKGAFYFYIKAPRGNAFQFSLDLFKRGVLVAPAFSRRTTHFRVAYAEIEKKWLKKLVAILKEAAVAL